MICWFIRIRFCSLWVYPYQSLKRKNSRNLNLKVTTIVYYLKNSSFSIVSLPILLLEYELPLYLCQSVKTVSNNSSDFFCRYSFEILCYSKSSLVCLIRSSVIGTSFPWKSIIIFNFWLFILYTWLMPKYALSEIKIDFVTNIFWLLS